MGKRKRQAEPVAKQPEDSKTGTKKVKTPKKGGKKKPKNDAKAKETASDIITLEDVLEMGGTEDDFRLLQTLSDDDDDDTPIVTEDPSLTASNADLNAIKDFLGKLQLPAAGQKSPAIIKDEGEEEEKEEESQPPKKKTEQPKIDIPKSMLPPQLRDNVVGLRGSDWQRHDRIDDVGDTMHEEETVKNVIEYAEKLVAHDTERYLHEQQRNKSSRSDASWIDNILVSGTLPDKLAALTLQVQESPLHRLNSLDSLMSILKKKGKREALLAMDSLRELFVDSLLLQRKYIPLAKRPLHTVMKRAASKKMQIHQDKTILVWYLEDILKQRYRDFVDTLQTLTHDTQVPIRDKVVGVVFQLIKEKPEQEQALLTALANKFGDKERKIAAKTVHLLSLLVREHPNMKPVVVAEVQQVLYRPNVGRKAQHYAICFLNQLELSSKEGDLALRLINLYFNLFEASFKSKGEMGSKLLSALLTGINRAYPFAEVDNEKFDSHVQKLFMIVHHGNFNCSVQALMLLLQVMDSRSVVSDRFYRALYAKLLDGALRTSSKQSAFLNVVYRAMKLDPVTKRTKAFIKRLLQICFGQQAGFVCGVMYLISEFIKLKPATRSMIDLPEEDDEEENFIDAEDDSDVEDSSTNQQVGNVDDMNGKGGETDSDSDIKKETEVVNTTKTPEDSKKQKYDPVKREPMYAGGDQTCLWELSQLANHFHPSVASFAKQLIEGDPIKYDGDPLQDYALMRFLDKFVYKNAKKKSKDHGGSLMQRKVHSKLPYQEPLNSEAFRKRKETDVDVSERFYLKYFKQKAKKQVRATDTVVDAIDDIAKDVDDDFDFAKAFGVPDGDEDFMVDGDGEDVEINDVDDDGVELQEDEDGIGAALGDSDSEEIDFEEDSDLEGELDLDAIAVASSESEGGDDDDEGERSVFADADDFAHLLEENVETKDPAKLWEEGRKYRKSGKRPKRNHAGKTQRKPKKKRG